MCVGGGESMSQYKSKRDILTVDGITALAVNLELMSQLLMVT